MNLCAAAGYVFSCRPHMVFHISAAENTARIDVFESREYFLWSTLRDVNDYIQAPPVAHSHYQFDCAVPAGAFKDFINQRDESGDAFERKTLGSQISLL